MANKQPSSQGDSSKQQRIAELHAQGVTKAEIARRLGVSRNIVYGALKRLEQQLPPRCCQCGTVIASARLSVASEGMLCDDCFDRWWASVPVGAILRAFRQSQGQTLGEVTRRAGLLEQDVRLYETGTKQPSPETADRLLRALGSRLNGKK